jgi:hypothetical protein
MAVAVVQGELLEVVGGLQTGGLIVRREADKASEETGRLATGSVVQALQCEASRVRFTLLTGDGPAEGWVSSHVGNRPLLVAQGTGKLEDECALEASTEASTGAGASETEEEDAKEGEQALRLYSRMLAAAAPAAKGSFWPRPRSEEAAKGQLAPEAEKRVCVGDKEAYTFAQFVSFFGMAEGRRQWELAAKPQDVSAELAKELGLGAESGNAEGLGLPRAELCDRLVDRPFRTFSPLQATLQTGSRKTELLPTFGYPVGLSKKPSYARFDIRDDICRHVGGFKHGQVVRDRDNGQELVVVGVKPSAKSGQACLWVRDLSKPGAVAIPHEELARLEKVLKHNSYSLCKRIDLHEATPNDFEAAEDSDGEEMLLCLHCHLPVGMKLYGDDEGNPMHGECMAQLMLKEIKEDEAKVRDKEVALKRKRRQEYDIGWRSEHIPRNPGSAAKLLALERVPQGMCCLTLQETPDGPTVQVAPASDPAARLNLEYLSLALRVRVIEGRELMFSLDPLEDCLPSAPEKRKDQMQVKNFNPTWLRGTSAGEVLFQADYHLKELSMGEYEQPVVGMKSSSDFFWEETNWRAREWFVIRHAEIQMTQDNVLIPCLKMGVEAREQVLGVDGSLDDKCITRPDHPLAKYAKGFTENFDLIAERKSVFYHLRELGRASVLAKFLVEAEVCMDEAWLDLAGEASNDCWMEVPQLWNERRSAQIQVQHGKIVDSKEAPACKARGVYGGVSFGLSKFTLSSAALRPSARTMPSAPVRAVPSISLSDLRTASALVASLQAAAPPAVVPEAQAVGLAGPAAGAPGMPSGMPGMPMMRPGAVIAAPSVPMPSAKFPSALASRLRMTAGAIGQLGLGVGAAGKPSPLDPAGVDLNLDSFSLDEPVRIAEQKAAADWGAAGTLADAFWASLDSKDGAKVFSEQDQRLLKAVFNPHLSDRRSEGDAFALPDPSPEYVEHLRCLVRQEDTVREYRKQHFLSASFSADEPGSLFPYSWAKTCEIAVGWTEPGTKLELRPDYLVQARTGTFDQALRAATPDFDRVTEEGLRFRTYRFGSVEVRTTQELGGQEVIGAVFSVRGPASSPQCADGGERQRRPAVQEHELIAKVSEYVEADAAHFRSYLVLETSEDNVILTEKLADGTVTWEENPVDLEDRNSLAKFIRSWDCSQCKKSIVTVGDMLGFRKLAISGSGTSHSSRKLYAQGAYNRARGLDDRFDSGFGSKDGWHKCEKAKLYRKETNRAKLLAKRKEAEAERSARASRGEEKRRDLKVENPVIVGTWNDWKFAEPLAFDEEARCYSIDLEVEEGCSECFQILYDNDWERCLHPDRAHCSDRERHKLCGPDGKGHEKNWIVRAHEGDSPGGAVFRIVLKVGADGLAEKVAWEPL